MYDRLSTIFNVYVYRNLIKRKNDVSNRVKIKSSCKASYIMKIKLHLVSLLDLIIYYIYYIKNLTGKVYLNLLLCKNWINVLITEITENDQNLNVDRLYFQQDDASPHYVAAVRLFLNSLLDNRLKREAQLNSLPCHSIYRLWTIFF